MVTNGFRNLKKSDKSYLFRLFFGVLNYRHGKNNGVTNGRKSITTFGEKVFNRSKAIFPPILIVVNPEASQILYVPLVHLKRLYYFIFRCLFLYGHITAMAVLRRTPSIYIFSFFVNLVTFSQFTTGCNCIVHLVETTTDKAKFTSS